jgi:hypothetical protein
MVRNLRDSGTLDSGAQPSRLRRRLKLVIAAVGFGLVAYFAATLGGPALLHAMEKKPPAMSFAKPG